MNIDYYNILRATVHYGLHLAFPGLVAWVFFRDEWKKAWLIMLATMLVDLDHLLSMPVFDPNRCSIGSHVLHSYPAIVGYILLLFVPNKTVRMVAAGLVLHMLTDLQDYYCWLL